jgi:hypothetical protein
VRLDASLATAVPKRWSLQKDDTIIGPFLVIFTSTNDASRRTKARMVRFMSEQPPTSICVISMGTHFHSQASVICNLSNVANRTSNWLHCQILLVKGGNQCEQKIKFTGGNTSSGSQTINVVFG